MSPPSGSRLGAYEIVDLLGEGGMGAVYRARDTRLERHVALKLVLEPFLADRERGLRFEREAKTLASLNHPNIATLHGIEQAEGRHFLVMELVEGETLGERIARHPSGLPIEETLQIAKQIADAVEAAHEKGVVHRDLKPANVKITRTGLVKVLDFGLARILADASDESTIAATVTGPAAILGTPAYMAPEQAEGRDVDERADIWAFGVLLYETLTGERLFRGASVQDTLASVLTADPDWQRIPPTFQPLLRACLERNVTKRLRAIGDYRFLLAIEPQTVAPQLKRSRLWPIAASGAAVSILAAVVAWQFWREPPQAFSEPVRLTTMLPAGVNVTRGPGYASSVAVSPDGRTLVIAATTRDVQQLYRRPLDRLDATPIAGTERGSSPFFSWDGRWIGFFADGRLKRVPVEGGAPVDIAPTPGFPAGASWGPDKRIVFAYGAEAGLHLVSADGGTVESLPGIESARHPEALADGRTVLFESEGWIHAFDRVSGRVHRLVQGTAPRYADGYVILSRGTTLLAARVDLSRYQLTGSVAALVEGVAVELPGSGGGRHFALSNNGTLVYVPAPDAYALALVSADGSEQLITAPARSFENPRFSPDGRRVVVAATRREGESADLWLHDLDTRTATRLTFDGGRAPVWTRDGTTVTYSHTGEGRGIYSKRADGRGDASRLISLNAFHWLVGWSPDSRTLAYGLMEKRQSSSIISHTDGETRRVVGPASTWGGRLSRDGRWLAYYVLESGTFEIYVTPFPEGGTRWLIATGTDPAWGQNDGELYFRSGPRLMAARIDKTAGVRVLSQRVVLEPFLPPLYDDYDIHPDGRTLVVVRPANRTHGREATMVLNWIVELRRLLGTS